MTLLFEEEGDLTLPLECRDIAEAVIDAALDYVGCPYEAEINLVIHAGGGEIDVEISPECISMVLTDQGPGIPDVALAMKEGYSTAPDNVRSLGFGAGMGLPNIKKYTDEMKIDSTVGVGTTMYLKVYTN